MEGIEGRRGKGGGGGGGRERAIEGVCEVESERVR